MSATRTRRPPALPMWHVEIREHIVGGRYTVPSQSQTLGAPDAELALRFAIQTAHIDAGVPPMRSLGAASIPHATVHALEDAR